MCEAALPFAGLTANLFGASVRLVHVVDNDAAKSRGEFERARELFENHVKELASEHLPAGVEYETVILRGSAAKTILENAADARLIVISTHGAGGLKATFIGSVTDKVVRGTSVPVLVIPGLGTEAIRPSGPVLIAVDGSPESEQGLVAGRELAQATGAGVALPRAYSIQIG